MVEDAPKQGNTDLKSIFSCFLLFPESSQSFPVFTGKKRAFSRENEMAHDAKCLDCYFFIFCNKNREELRRLKMHKKQENIGLKSIFPCFLLFLESSQFFPVQ